MENLTVADIDAKNLTDLWRGCIKFAYDHPRDASKRYILYSTGEASFNGRVYIALPKEVYLSESVKKKYHILWNVFLMIETYEYNFCYRWEYEYCNYTYIQLILYFDKYTWIT